MISRSLSKTEKEVQGRQPNSPGKEASALQGGAEAETLVEEKGW